MATLLKALIASARIACGKAARRLLRFQLGRAFPAVWCSTGTTWRCCGALRYCEGFVWVSVHWYSVHAHCDVILVQGEGYDSRAGSAAAGRWLPCLLCSLCLPPSLPPSFSLSLSRGLSLSAPPPPPPPPSLCGRRWPFLSLSVCGRRCW
eukprot:COSAG01_NODE_6922_length_3438_cov_3.977838_5_plen_150_part_00